MQKLLKEELMLIKQLTDNYPDNSLADIFSAGEQALTKMTDWEFYNLMYDSYEEVDAQDIPSRKEMMADFTELKEKSIDITS
jgi:hypothetical protein